MILRPYQASALAGVQAVYRSGRRRALLVAPTGSGKSAMTRHMLERTTKRTLILCHRAELQDMICESLPGPHGVIGGSRAVPREAVHVGMMQTVARRLDVLPRYEWVISDEAHLAMCPTWRSILQHYADAWHLGLSATPCRLDGKGLGAEYEQIVYGPTIRELTARGYLAPCRVFAPAATATVGADLQRLSMDAAGEYLDRPGITGDVIAHYQRIAPGRQAIVFCSSRAHADHVAAAFSAAGIPAVNVDGGMSKAERSARIGDFRARRVQALVNVDLLTTGFDCPQIEVGIMLRRTESLALYLQKVGRILRIADGKRDAVLLDHVGNTLLHGLPDANRDWTLDGRLQRKAPMAMAGCPRCHRTHAPAPSCPSCGYAYASRPAPPRRAPEVRDGVLELVDGVGLEQLGGQRLQDALRAARGSATDGEARVALERIRKAMGYQAGWVFLQMQMRRGTGVPRKGRPAHMGRVA